MCTRAQEEAKWGELAHGGGGGWYWPGVRERKGGNFHMDDSHTEREQERERTHTVRIREQFVRANNAFMHLHDASRNANQCSKPHSPR